MKVHVDKNNTVTINGREVRGFKRGLVLFFVYLLATILAVFACLFIVTAIAGYLLCFFILGGTVLVLAGFSAIFWAVGRWFKRG